MYSTLTILYIRVKLKLSCKKINKIYPLRFNFPEYYTYISLCTLSRIFSNEIKILAFNFTLFERFVLRKIRSYSIHEFSPSFLRCNSSPINVPCLGVKLTEPSYRNWNTLTLKSRQNRRRECRTITTTLMNNSTMNRLKLLAIRPANQSSTICCLQEPRNKDSARERKRERERERERNKSGIITSGDEAI